ncbi:DUF3883 domain-containing protein [Comamonas kerstersii]|uniref:Protein NO VEIN C-terminal domain-containing protein n=1 Tax=Comamonas kerstersii TaxID=225992 RepID=A0A0W7YY59_9BURK|nr:DUF3883 domain-containing protein [Comamonas kerstersii]KUF39899.1 hypothetical protein AS359_13780 [Comamonas kerstersii]
MRDVEMLLQQAADKCVQAHRVLLERGASVIHETGHGSSADAKGRKLPALTYGFEGTPAVVRMALTSSDKANQGMVTLYVRASSQSGQALCDRLPEGVLLKETYAPGTAKPAASVLACTYMGPKHGHQALMLHVAPFALHALLDIYLDEMSAPARHAKPATPVTTSPLTATTARVMDADMFQALLERRSEIGQQGEQVALQFEMARLRRMGCPDPERHVQLVAQSDVGRGYDIHTTYGEERCIEVKSSPSPAATLYLSENERQVLTTLGDKAWLYRVALHADGCTGNVLAVQNPMSCLEAHLEPVAYRIDARLLTPSS